jgi:hypothetical protein
MPLRAACGAARAVGEDAQSRPGPGPPRSRRRREGVLPRGRPSPGRVACGRARAPQSSLQVAMRAALGVGRHVVASLVGVGDDVPTGSRRCTVRPTARPSVWPPPASVAHTGMAATSSSRSASTSSVVCPSSTRMSCASWVTRPAGTRRVSSTRPAGTVAGARRAHRPVPAASPRRPPSPDRGPSWPPRCCRRRRRRRRRSRAGSPPRPPRRSWRTRSPSSSGHRLHRTDLTQDGEVVADHQCSASRPSATRQMRTWSASKRRPRTSIPCSSPGTPPPRTRRDATGRRAPGPGQPPGGPWHGRVPIGRSQPDGIGGYVAVAATKAQRQR